MKSIMNRTALALMLSASSMGFLSGCTNDEIAASAFIIGAVAVATDDDYDGHRYHRHHRHGRRGRHHFHSAAGMSDFVSTDPRVVKMADKYDITHYAATYLVRAIVMAETKDLSGVKDLGLEIADFKDLYEGKALSAEKIDVMSTKLLLPNIDTARAMNELMIDVQAEKAARGI